MTENQETTIVRHRGAITVTVMLASSIYALDWTIASVALPHMQGTFSVTQDQISWVITSYIVVSAIVLPTTSWLAARFGRRNLFMFAVIGFTLFSVLCGAAQSLPAEIFFRIGQGASGAFLIPLSQSIMLDSYPRNQHARAMALWGVGVMMGPVIGPTVGGYLTDLHNWRWVFYINLPLGVLALLGAVLFLPKAAADRETPGFDWPGFAYLSLAIGSLQVMLDRGERLDWLESGEVVIEASLMALGFYLFLVHSAMARNPLVNLRILADRNYSLGMAFIFLYGLLTLAPMVLLPPFLQTLQGYPITQVGLLLSPRGIGMMLSMIFFGRFGDRFDPRLTISVGFSLLAVSNFVMAGWTLEVAVADVAWTGFVQGIGAGAIVVPLGAVTFATLDIRHRTEASAIWNLIRSVGSAIGIAAATTVLVRMTGVNRALLAEHITPFVANRLQSPVAAGSQNSLAMIESEVTRQAWMIGYIDVFYAAGITSLLVLPLILLLRRAEASG